MRYFLRKSVFFILVVLLSAQFAYSFEDDSYNTPDNWSQHITAGRVIQSTTGVGLTDDTNLYTTLTTRLRLKSNEYADDSDVFQYVRMHTDPAALGQGTIKLSIYGRIADDLDGDSDKEWGNNYYYAQRDILDAETGSDTLSGRLYQGNVLFDNVIKNTSLKLGRLYLDHLNTFQIDGGDAAVNIKDVAGLYAFGGQPVSYYYDLDDASVYGAGGFVKLGEDTRLQAEFTKIDTGDFEDDYTKARLVQLIPGGSVILGFERLNDSNTYSADIDYSIAATGTIVTLGYKTLSDDLTSDKTYVTNPITYALMDQSRYNRYKASVYQPFLKYFVAGFSYEAKDVSGEENFDNRDFKKYGFKFDINGLITEDTYISITVDKWDVEENSEAQDNNSLMYGFQLSQKLSEEMDAYLGTSFSKYEYDYLTDTRKDSVRSYYVGCEYQATETFGLIIDFSREDTDFYDDVDNDLSTSYVTEIWANLAF
jgi:hypothetical protein